MNLNDQNNISDEFADTELGGEAGIPAQYHATPAQVSAKGVPTHPVLDTNENEEEVLGI